jgi:prophage regulatory protein
MKYREVSMPNDVPHTAGKLNQTNFGELGGRVPREVTSKVTGASCKKPISDLLGVELDPENSLIASCVRDLCLRIGAVSSITGLSVPTIYREIAQDRFPRPIKITAGARAWKLSEIMDWIETRERDQGQR